MKIRFCHKFAEQTRVDSASSHKTGESFDHHFFRITGNAYPDLWLKATCQVPYTFLTQVLHTNAYRPPITSPRCLCGFEVKDQPTNSGGVLNEGRNGGRRMRFVDVV